MTRHKVNVERLEERARFLAPFVEPVTVGGGSGTVCQGYHVPSLNDPKQVYLVKTWDWPVAAWHRWSCNCRRGQQGAQGERACTHVRAARIHAGEPSPAVEAVAPAAPAAKPKRDPWLEEIDMIGRSLRR